MKSKEATTIGKETPKTTYDKYERAVKEAIARQLASLANDTYN